MPECRFTSTALGALRLAQENAARLGHSYVGSEHLLLGLASQEYSAAARSLQSSGVDSRSLRSAISQLVGTGVPPVPPPGPDPQVLPGHPAGSGRLPPPGAEHCQRGAPAAGSAPGP